MNLNVYIDDEKQSAELSPALPLAVRVPVVEFLSWSDSRNRPVNWPSTPGESLTAAPLRSAGD